MMYLQVGFENLWEQKCGDHPIHPSFITRPGQCGGELVASAARWGGQTPSDEFETLPKEAHQSASALPAQPSLHRTSKLRILAH